MVDINRTQIVHQIFTFALNLNNKNNNPANKNVQNAAQMILNASYEGTLKAAAHAGKPRLFLTLMGASAFGNDIRWLGHSLMRSVYQDIIKQSGLQVTLIFRPEKRKQTRNAADDFSFFKESLLPLYDTINNTHLSTDKTLLDTLEEYLKTAYGQADEDKLHAYAETINQYLMEPARTEKPTARTGAGSPKPGEPAAGAAPKVIHAIETVNTIQDLQDVVRATLLKQP
jgi:hypothetical protein